MKMTLNIDGGVYRRLKEQAARGGITVSALVESALRRILEEATEPAVSLEPLPTFESGGHRVDIANRQALQDYMDQG